MALHLDERKVCTLGLAKLMAQDEVRQNQAIFSGCCESLVGLLGLQSSATATVRAEASDDEAPLENGGAGLEYEISFNKLQNTDLPGAAAGLAPDVQDLPAAVKPLLQPHLPAIMQIIQVKPEFQALVGFLQ